MKQKKVRGGKKIRIYGDQPDGSKLFWCSVYLRGKKLCTVRKAAQKLNVSVVDFIGIALTEFAAKYEKNSVLNEI